MDLSVPSAQRAPACSMSPALPVPSRRSDPSASLPLELHPKVPSPRPLSCLIQGPTSGHCASASCCCCCHCLSQITLQLASGAFLLDEPFCEAVSIPMEKLRWSSPFPSHRATASPTVHSCCSPAGQETGDGESLTDGSPQASSPSQADSGRGSETDCSEALCLPSGGNGGTDPGGTLWATAVALAWLEHSSATSFIEWELVAAKASTWLNSQPIPEGRDLPTIKASARQLFVLLRHWDENLQLNVLCYNPNSV
uniref:von Willebrand factor A domain containing 5B1 n=1 Tax=Callorhinchus milii TaxID=7868 RepID=A0A4W3GND4_CALMI